MARIKEQEIFVNPYVVQMDKFAESLQHLSKTFLNMEHYKGTLSKEEIDEMFDKVTGNVRVFFRLLSLFRRTRRHRY